METRKNYKTEERRGKQQRYRFISGCQLGRSQPRKNAQKENDTAKKNGIKRKWKETKVKEKEKIKPMR